MFLQRIAWCFDSVPVPEGSCMPCDHGQYRLPQWDVCQDCHWPRLLMGQNCVWQHLPLIPIGAIALVLLLCLIWDRARRCRDGENQRRNESKTTTIKKLEEELWDETPGTTLTLEKYTKDLQAFGMKEDEARSGRVLIEKRCPLPFMSGRNANPERSRKAVSTTEGQEDLPTGSECIDCAHITMMSQ